MPSPVNMETIVDATELLYNLLRAMLPVILYCKEYDYIIKDHLHLAKYPCRPCDNVRQEMAEAVTQLKSQELLLDIKEMQEKRQSEHLQVNLRCLLHYVKERILTACQ